MYLIEIEHQEASNASLVQDKDPSKKKYNAPRSSHPFFIIQTTLKSRTRPHQLLWSRTRIHLSTRRDSQQVCGYLHNH
ncbi:hypothetical protein Bca4012_040417 [Brassica carinata]